MRKRKLKDPSLYLHPTVAASRLISAAMEVVLWQRFGTRVKWTLKIEYLHEKDFKPGRNQLAVSLGGTIRSGPAVSAEDERQLTGHMRPATFGTCKFCGCTDERACEEGCSWLDESHTVCSADGCREAQEEALHE